MISNLTFQQKALNSNLEIKTSNGYNQQHITRLQKQQDRGKPGSDTNYKQN